jgi:RsiW-degrading membrane proteinase PrsW (M82 family)
MPISFACTCGKRFRVKDELAGKRARCPGCQNIVIVPEPGGDEEIIVVPETNDAPPPKPIPWSEVPEGEAPTYGVSREPDAPRPMPGLKPKPRPSQEGPPPRRPVREPQERIPPRRPVREPEERTLPRRPSADRYKHILEEKSETSLRDWAYLGLILTLIPLAFTLLGKQEASIEKRLERTLEKASDAQRHRIKAALDDERVDLDTVLEMLPGNRIEGAHLPRRTFLHFLYALLAAIIFFLLALFIFPSETGRPLPPLLTGLFTGTAGIALLLLAQFLAEVTQGHILISRNIFIMVIYWVAWVIGFSYRAALDPETGFLPSFLGYTFGVGLCEEVCKALPLIWYYRTSAQASWREARSWGFTSGVGFGVAEAVMYAGDYYNGIAPASTYVVRFVSCIALHAIWSAAVALFIYRYQGLIQGDFEWYEWIPRVIALVSVPMVLHGLYDTALKKEMNALALITALASFGWLVWCTAWAKAGEEPVEPKPKARYA